MIISGVGNSAEHFISLK